MTFPRSTTENNFARSFPARCHPKYLCNYSVNPVGGKVASSAFGTVNSHEQAKVEILAVNKRATSTAPESTSQIAWPTCGWQPSPIKALSSNQAMSAFQAISNLPVDTTGPGPDPTFIETSMNPVPCTKLVRSSSLAYLY